SNKPYAEDAAREVDRTLDAYASAWISAKRDACEATYVRREQSEDLLDRRTRCLADRRAELASLVTLLATDGAADKAVAAAHAIEPVATCANVTVLRASFALPSDPNVRTEIDLVNRQIGEIRALLDLGRPKDAVEKSGHALELAQKTGF